MSFVAVDIGASGTRFVSDQGKISAINNNMVFLQVGDEVDLEPYDNNIENALEVDIIKEEESEYFPVKALIGQMAERYSSNNERPSVMKNKHTQAINYISAITAVALSKVRFGLGEDIELYLALPPIEARTAKKHINNVLNGRYTVTFPKYNGGLTVEFNITSVSSFEESFMAMVSYFFEMNGLPKASSKKYMSGNILSLDIGASTTDLAIVKDGRYLDKSGQTYKTGGNIARDYLIDSIRAKYGFDIPVEDAETTMAEGRIQLGNTYEDVSDLVAEAKHNFARSVVNQMQGYFRQVDIPIQTIRAIVVSGGGSMQGQFVDANGEIVETSKPMSYYITEALKEVCPGVEVEQHGESPRLANIAGLFIRAKVDMAKKRKAKAK